MALLSQVPAPDPQPPRLALPRPLFTLLQPEQIRQCLVDYASINVWQLQGSDGDAPSIVLAQ